MGLSVDSSGVSMPCIVLNNNYCFEKFQLQSHIHIYKDIFNLCVELNLNFTQMMKNTGIALI